MSDPKSKPKSLIVTTFRLSGVVELVGEERGDPSMRLLQTSSLSPASDESVSWRRRARRCARFAVLDGVERALGYEGCESATSVITGFESEERPTAADGSVSTLDGDCLTGDARPSASTGLGFVPKIGGWFGGGGGSAKTTACLTDVTDWE